ncbi:Ars binding protein 1 [Globisporangium polare]
MTKRAAGDQNAHGAAPLPMDPPAGAATTTVQSGADAAVATAHSFAAAMAASASPGGAAASAPRKRLKKGNIFLTNEQRQALCIKAATSKVTQAQLCFWAKEEFALTGPLNQSTVSRILAEKDKYISLESSHLAQKRKTYVEHPQLEAALSHWLLVSSHNNRRLQGDLIKEKGRAFAQLLGIDDKISFSNGWLTGFKKRHQTILSNAPSEAVLAAATTAGPNGFSATTPSFAADIASAATGVAIDLGSWNLQQTLQDYNARDIFNVDETGLFYAMSPEKTPRKGASGGGNANAGAAGGPVKPASKERLTMLLAVNADGSERLDPLFIGSSRRTALETSGATATASGRKKQQQQHAMEAANANAGVTAEPAFNYSYSERTWVNAIVFQKWLNTLNSQMKIEDRHILLLVDDAPSHITRGLKLTNIRVLKFPSTTTQGNSAAPPASGSVVQPLEVGIVAAFKRRYRKRQMVHALDRHEAGDADIYSVNELQAMRWCRAAWHDVPKSLVVRCWLNSHLFGEMLLPPLTKDDALLDEAENELDSVIKEISYKLPLKRVMALKEILSPPDECDSLHFMGSSDEDFLSIADELPAAQAFSNSLSASISSSETAGTGSSALSSRASSGPGAVEGVASAASSSALANEPLNQSQGNSAGVSTATGVNTANGDTEGSKPSASAANNSSSRNGTGDQVQQQREDSPIADAELLSYVQKIVPNLERLGCDERTIQAMRDVRQSLKQRLALAAKSKPSDSAAAVSAIAGTFVI